jgi:trimeric autotransporter adhesin
LANVATILWLSANFSARPWMEVVKLDELARISQYSLSLTKSESGTRCSFRSLLGLRSEQRRPDEERNLLMYPEIFFAGTNFNARNVTGCLLSWRGLLVVSLAWFLLVQKAEALPFTDTAYGTQALGADTGGSNSAFGYFALTSNTTGSDNTATGTGALLSNSTGNQNTAIGSEALAGTRFNGGPAYITGDRNTGIGYRTLFSLTIGSDNTASGFEALFTNNIGNANTATGSSALKSNTSGSSNTATGLSSLQSNTTGSFNTATGLQALLNNTTGAANTATGSQALSVNTTGGNNTATGFTALQSNANGNDNTADGFEALLSNTTGSDNTAVGLGALINNSSGKTNVAVGSNAGQNLTIGSNNIDIGANVLGKAGESGKIRIGKQGTQNGTFIAGIYNIAEPATTGVIKPVYINSNGQLGTAPPASSVRFKTNIRAMDKASEAILSLKPVTFEYKNDEESTPQFGLIAEEVAKLNPDLVVRDDTGEIYTVRYEAVNAMLLNEFLKEHRGVAEQHAKVAEQQSTIAELKTTVAQQQKQIEALTATVRSVSERVQLSAPAAQVAANEN